MERKKVNIMCIGGPGRCLYRTANFRARKQEILANPNMQPKLDKYDYVVGRQLRPKARMDIIHELRELGVIPTSMIDISDGLLPTFFISVKNQVLVQHL